MLNKAFPTTLHDLGSWNVISIAGGTGTVLRQCRPIIIAGVRRTVGQQGSKSMI